MFTVVKSKMGYHKSHYGYLPRMVQGWNRGYKRLQIYLWIIFPSEDWSGLSTSGDAFDGLQ